MNEQYCLLDTDDFKEKAKNEGAVVMVARNPHNGDHRHLYFELGYVASGTARHILNGNETVIRQGDFFLMDLESRHAYYGDADCRVINLLFYPWVIDPLLSDCRKIAELVNHYSIGYLPQDIGVLQSRIFHDEGGKVERLMEQISEELYFSRSGAKALVRAYMIELIVEILRTIGERQQAHYTTVTQDILAVVERHFADRLTLSQIAERLGYTVPYLSRRFKEDIGIPFGEYLQRTRLEAACRMLISTKYTVGQIAANVGYTDTRFFYKLFARTYGCSPTRYRKK